MSFTSRSVSVDYSQTPIIAQVDERSRRTKCIHRGLISNPISIILAHQHNEFLYCTGMPLVPSLSLKRVSP